MRRKRQSKPIWQQTRKRIWRRDRGKCQGPYCEDKPLGSLPLRHAHIDHIKELRYGGTNADSNLRTLCRFCHTLRANKSHQGMIAQALRDGVIPPHWRSLVWE
ncbi:HNH endonuclease signature motif containing protein [Leptolyngbya sp. FACHB-16]|uniref:HNH endonuclease n=1 Tax=unclassified Leptolyngbya TaxID=2650499 RepID=UPI00168901C7|nr:HNH endonuclease signature motif containing protein [Leptolyngbya sp. FACHB-16]MBD2157025.1 HNH endonuclease [Leptolyngbya sp. FACHB-16]